MAKRKKGKKTNNGLRNTIQTIQWPSEKRAKRGNKRGNQKP